MGQTPPFLPRLFAEMKRRKVFRVMAVYGIVGFVVLQIVDLAVPALLLPDWTYRLIALILLIGLPVAIVLAWAFEQTPEGLKRTERADPGEIEAIVAQPASKRWPAGLLAVAGVVIMFGGWWMGRQTAPDTSDSAEAPSGEARLVLPEPVEDARPSIAVLPFADMSPEGDQEYFSDGMTDEIMNVLVKVDQFRVPARTSTFTYKEQEKDARQIGSELGVGYLVEGSVRKAGDMLRITAQLIDTDTDEHLWSETYDRELTAENVFDIQTEIAMAIADALTVPMGLEDGERLVAPTADLAAYDLYLAGRSKIRERGLSRARSAGLAEAVELFEAAIARDSFWAPAWAGLAEAAELRAWYPLSQPEGLAPSEYIPRALAQAEQAARRALDLDPNHASALVALGSVHRDRAEWEDAETAYLEALTLDPDNAEAHQQYGELLLNIGRAAEAVRATDRAAVLDPTRIRFAMLSTALEIDGRLDESIEAYEKVVAVSSSRLGTLFLARRYMLAGRSDDAIDALDHWNRAHPERDDVLVGNREQIADAVAGLRHGTLAGPVEHLFASSTQWLMLGQPDSAVAELLEEAEDRPFGRTIEMRRLGTEPIHSDPRIQTFFAERGLPGVEFQRTPVSERERPMALRGPAR